MIRISTDLQKAAMRYAQLGFAIFPLKWKAKVPLTTNGVKDASNDPAVIQGWWEKWPNANIGLATGTRNNLLVVDLDIDDEKGINGYESLREWEREHGELPDTWRSITGRGGYHWIYRTSEHFANKVGLLEGIDIRGDNGYIVAPPSLHPNGKAYEWEQGPEDEEPIADVNDMVRLLLQEGEKRTTAEKVIVPEVIPEGKRNDTMFRIACSLQSKGLGDDAILAALMADNKTKCKPPLKESELKTIVDGVTQKFAKGQIIHIDQSGEAYQGQRDPQLARNDKGFPKQTIDNAAEAIRYDRELYGKIFYNELSYAPFVRGSLPWDPNPKNYREWNNFDDSCLKSYVEKKYDLKSGDKCMEGLNIVISQCRFNPVTEMLDNIWRTKWDGSYTHIRKLLPYYLGVDDNEYTYEVMKVFMLGAICRAFRPGCKFDYMMVIVGPQGVGKSTFLRYLSMNNSWYDDNFNTIEGDKASERLRGMWIVEMAELLATKRAREIESIKAFITSTVDSYRPPYNRRTEQRPRSCVFAGTTNDDFFLSDRSGNRRFLPVESKKDQIKQSVLEDEDQLIEDIELAWAEAMQIFKDCREYPKLVLPSSVMGDVDAIQAKHTEDDPNVGIIQYYLDNLDSSEKVVCVPQIMVEAFHMDMSRVKREFTKPFHTIMRTQIKGWVQLPKKKRCGQYGPQIGYERVKTEPDKGFSIPEDADPDDLPF